ncbi:MAG: acetyl-CoA carboxylase biotin carboxylase subunit [Actinomycetota bacterium]
MRKLLVANRGEIAVRIIRSARELGIPTVAVASEADVQARHVALADEHVVIGPAAPTKSYLDMDAVLAAAKVTGAEAIHPGYGFLSERASFAERVTQEGLVFVGPSAHAIRTMGDKALARRTAAAAGVPTVPGSDGSVDDETTALLVAEEIGYPVAIKAAAGGGGRGIRLVRDRKELRETLPVARAEAAAAFGSAEVYLEKFVPDAKHIEVQIFGDGERFVHLGERECSLQRRRQKVIEESPSALLPDDTRAALLEAGTRLAAEVDYTGAGTVEFLYDQRDDSFYFIEMNTRLQVEHPVTEMVTGRDLVREQLRVASGEPLSFRQDDVQVRGHAIEFRINAEDARNGFMPSPGRITEMRLPGGPFVRVDCGFDAGSEVTPFYDSLIAKVIVWDETRELAISRGRRALEEVLVRGISTTAEFLRDVLDSPGFVDGSYHTTYLEAWMNEDSGAPVGVPA